MDEKCRDKRQGRARAQERRSEELSGALRREGKEGVAEGGALD